MLIATVLKNGTISCVSCGLCAVQNRARPAPSAPTDCQKYFQRAGRPRGFFSITLRQSSTQPTAPNTTSTPRVIHTKRLLRSAHSRVEMAIEIRIRPPPMVGVPALLRWLLGPSSRIA